MKTKSFHGSFPPCVVTALIVAVLFGWLLAAPVVACPFCRSAPTISGRLKNEDIPIAVVAELLPATGNERLRTYRIVKVLKGEERAGGGDPTFKARHVEGATPGQRFFTTAALVGEPPTPYWDSPQREPVTGNGLQYLERLPQSPPEGRARLEFFLPHLNDPDAFIAEDVYAEIAAASFDDIKSLGELWPRDKLLAWVADDRVPFLRRRQFLVLLGVCGRPDDAATLEELIQRDPGGTGSVLDAAVASYLTLRGEAGLEFVQGLLNDPAAPYAKGMEIAKALRFHGDDETQIDKQKLLPLLRSMLDRPAWADQIIPDLARWEDWSAMDRLVQMFKSADMQDELSRLALRVAVAQYLLACPLPEAERQLAALRETDAAAVDQAQRYLILPGRGARRADVNEEDVEEPCVEPPVDEAAISAVFPVATDDAGLREPVDADAPMADDAASPGRAPADAAASGSHETAASPSGAAARPAPSSPPLEFPIWPALMMGGGLVLLLGLNAAILLAFRPRA